MTKGALQERPQGKEIILQSNQAGVGGSVPVVGSLRLAPREGKARQNWPPPPGKKPQLKSGKSNLKADTGEQLRLPRYFISQRELKSEAHTHRTARRPESRKPGSSFLICFPISGQRLSRDLAAQQGPGSWAGLALSCRRERAGSSHPKKRQPAPGASSGHGRARSVELGHGQPGVQRHLQGETQASAVSQCACWDSSWPGSWHVVPREGRSSTGDRQDGTGGAGVPRTVAVVPSGLFLTFLCCWSELGLLAP